MERLFGMKPKSTKGDGEGGYYVRDLDANMGGTSYKYGGEGSKFSSLLTVSQILIISNSTTSHQGGNDEVIDDGNRSDDNSDVGHLSPLFLKEAYII